MKQKNITVAGFTIIEVSVAAVLLVILGTGILGLQYTLGRTQLTAFSSFISSDEANSIVLTFTRELRTARNGENGAFMIESGGSNQVVFYSDVDFDGEAEKVQYTRVGTTLTRSVTEPTGFPVTYPLSAQTTRTVSSNIRNGVIPLFSYYNGDWPIDTINNPLPTPIDLLEVKLIKVYVRTNERADTPNSDFTGESFSSLRMAKDNL